LVIWTPSDIVNIIELTLILNYWSVVMSNTLWHYR